MVVLTNYLYQSTSLDVSTETDMSLTFADILHKLRLLDEITLMEVLEISSEDLVDKFEDKIEAKLDYLTDELEYM